MDHRRGLTLKEQQYNANNVLVKETVNTYGFPLKDQTASFKAAFSKTLPPNVDDPNPNVSFNCQWYSCTDPDGNCNVQWVCYNTYSEQVNLLTSTTTAYDQNGQNPLTTVVNNFYDNANNPNPIRVETTDSKGQTVKTFSRTPLEKADINAATPLSTSASAAIDTLLARNILSPVLQKEVQVAGVMQSRSLINYKNWTTSGSSA